MGTTNHGSQNITYEYFEEATSSNFNKKDVDIRPRGIYKGGHLKKVSDSEVTLTPFVLEIGDDDTQVSVKSSSNATLNSTTLDSGTISSSTPYLVFRWAHVEQQNNYVEVHAIASVSAAQSNDIIIGKCVFSGATLTGFDYTDRTPLNVQNIFLKVEPTEDTEMYVWVRSGRVHSSSQYIAIPEQKVGPFAVPGSPNSRIDLVYVDTSDGTVKIHQGLASTSPVAPSYDGKLVLAEVRIVNGDTNITADRITDVRAFLSPGSGNFSPTVYTGEESITLPNGLIIKQGSNSVSGNSSASVTFATPFPTSIINVVATFEWNNEYADAAGFFWIKTKSKTGFSVYNSEDSAGTFNWIALGY